MATVEDRKLMDHFKELLRKATANNMGESSTSSLQVEAFSEDSEVPSVTVPYETENEVIVTSAVEVLNLFLELFSSEEAIQAFDSVKASPALLVCNRVIHYASKLSRISGTDENIVMYLEQVIEYMQKNPGVVSAELRCLLLYACAKVFKKQGRTDKALRTCNSAREVTQLIANELTKIPLEIAISLLLVEINGIQGDPKELLIEVDGFLKQDHFLGGIDLVGFIREIPAAVAMDPRMTIGLIEALVMALSTDHGNRSCAAILLSLCKYYDNTSYPYRHHASQILVEQAILGLQQEKCTCRSDYIVYPSAFYREEECACHQLLADAWLYQGAGQQELGLSEGAEQSFQQGLKLSQSCKDKDRECLFHFMLYHLLMSKTHLYGNYGLPRVEEIPHDSFKQLSGAIRFHLQEFLKIAERPEASRGKDTAIPFLQVWSLGPITSLESFTDSFVSSSMEFLKKQERRGDFMSHARIHAELSSLYLRHGDTTSAREHFLLGLKYWREGGYIGLIYIGQVLGQIALRPEIMELDHAYAIWFKVYNWTQEKLEDIARINEEDALRYFETVKHASMSLAKCEMRKYGNLIDSRAETLVEMYNRNPLEVKEYFSQAFKPLMWAERGKGKMLMSYIGALQKNLDTKVEDSRLLERLNLPSDYPVNFESCFSKDDYFALGFLQGRPRTSQKVIFIEYTCIDNKHLMTHITSGSGDDLHSQIRDLSVTIDKNIRDEAERELDSLRKPSHSNVGVGSQPFIDPNTAGSSSRKEVSSGAEAANKVLSAMNKYGTNRVPFNRWIPGMVAGIQKRVTKVQLLRKRNKTILIQKVEREIRQLLQNLYGILIKPVEEYLFRMASFNAKDIATLVFVPHEDLGVVPYAALHERDGSAFLIEQFAISVSPAIWCSRHCEYLYEKKVCSDQAEGTPLLVGRKSGYKPPFGDLGEAHKEVQAVCKALGSTACKKVLDDSDSPDMRSGMKEIVKEHLPNASWIHFSVHGEVSPQFPQGSLLFGDNDDQRLTANEIITSAASSPWRARCAIASACQSGLGSVAGGGIMGFARSFILAGIPSCVLSMWEVNESFCTSFMEKLYSNLQSEETLGHAMRNTMICMMKEPVENYTLARKKTQSKRFKEPKTPIQTQSGEPMWSILDWAAFSCFGYPGVKLVPDSVVAKSNAKGKSPMDESAHDPLPVQHQQEFYKAMGRREIANLADGFADEASFGELLRPDRRNSVIPSPGTQAEPVRHLTQNPMQAPHVTYTGPSMIFTLFPIYEDLPPDYRLATVQEARDNRQALLKQMPRELIANLADGSESGASHGGSIREDTWRLDLRYKLATQHPPHADPRRDPSVSIAGTGMMFLPFPLGEELPPQYRLATLQEVRDNLEALLRAMPRWQIANLADGSVDGAFYGGDTRGKVWRNGVTHNLATQDLQQVDPGRDPSATKPGMGLNFALVPIAEDLPSQFHLATVQEVRDNREAMYRAMPNKEIAKLADGCVVGAYYGGLTGTETLDQVDYKLAASYPARASQAPDPTEVNRGWDPRQDYPRGESSVNAVARPSLTFSLVRVGEMFPPPYRLATVREVRENREALLRAMPGWEIANLADGSVDGALYGGHTRMDIRDDVGHRLATQMEIANLVDDSVDGACYGGLPRTERLDQVDSKLAALYPARASPVSYPTEANCGWDSRQDYPRGESSVNAVARPSFTFSLFRVDEVLPPNYRLATVREVQANREALLRAMPGWEIANLADGSVEGALYGGHTRMDIRDDVGHRLTTLLDNLLGQVEQDLLDLNYEEFY